MSRSSEILKILEGFKVATQFKREKKLIQGLLDFTEAFNVKVMELVELTKHTMTTSTKKMYTELYELSDESNDILRDVMVVLDKADETSLRA